MSSLVTLTVAQGPVTEKGVGRELKSGDILIAVTLSAFEQHRILIIDDDAKWMLYRPAGTVASRGKRTILEQLESGFYRKANFTLSALFKTHDLL